MLTSRVKTNLFLTFEVAAKWQNVGYTRRSYRLISLNQPTRKCYYRGSLISDWYVSGTVATRWIYYVTSCKKLEGGFKILFCASSKPYGNTSTHGKFYKMYRNCEFGFYSQIENCHTHRMQSKIKPCCNKTMMC